MAKRCCLCGRLLQEDCHVCENCAAKSGDLSTALITSPCNVQEVTANKQFKNEYYIDLVAVELKKDINYLIELGISLDKGALAAKAGCTLWAGYEVFTGDWFSALLVGGISLLSSGLTNSYKRIKLEEMKQKWTNILSDLNIEELEYIVTGLRHKYPLLLGQFQNLLQAGQK